ncbi:TPA: hypothetical protein HA251_01080 [Candidatus Woesearchaeota archaeon]|nr:hypothetical protein [Candidatus Woesearchaeota archaeon]
MNRRGNEGPGLLATIAIVLIVIVIAGYWLMNSSKNFGKANDCTNNGGTCQSMCDLTKGIVPAPYSCSKDGELCCRSLTGGGSGTANADGTPAGSGSGTSVQPPSFSLRQPVVTFSSGTATAIKYNPGSTITILAGMPEEPKIAFTQSTEYFATQKLVDDCRKYYNDPMRACGRGDWVTVIGIEDVSGKLLGSFTFDTAKGTSSGPITPASGVTGSIGTISVTAPSDVKDSKNADLMSTRLSGTITFGKESKILTDYAGQTLRLVVVVYSSQNGDQTRDAATAIFKTTQKLSIKPTYPVRIVKGLDNKWTREKTATVACDTQNVKCKNIAFKVVAATHTNIGSEEHDCGTVANNPTQLTVVKPKYYIVDTKTGKTTKGPYETYDQCMIAESGALSSSFSAAATPFFTALKNTGTADAELANTFLGFTQQTSSTKCRSSEDIMEKSSFTIGTTYWADTFDPATQTATIRLREANMAGQYLCVYGQDMNGGFSYVGGKGQRINIDRTPPQVDIKFDPFTLRMQFFCQDGLPEALGVTESGCKSTFGVAYIGDITKFLPALVSGAQSANTWCPTSGYSTETSRLRMYSGTEIKVLCMRGDDNAGNSAVTMATVFNGYDMLAKALVIYLEEREND